MVRRSPSIRSIYDGVKVGLPRAQGIIIIFDQVISTIFREFSMLIEV